MKFNKTTGKIFENDPNVRMPQKDLVSQIEKDKMVDEYMRSGGRDPNGRSLDQEIKIGKDMWLEKQKEENNSPLPSGMGNKYKSDPRPMNQKKKDAWDEKKYNIKQRLKNVRGPSTAELIYKGMSPQERGSHNAEQRRNNQDNPFGPRAVSGKPFPPDTFTLSTDQGPTTTIPKEVNQTMNNEIENIRQMRMDAERLRRIPERKIAIRKPEPAGLHEDFVREKLQIGSILKGEDEKV